MSLSARDISVHLGPRTVFSNLNFSLEEGEIVALIGPNGIGKTTLLRALSGLIKPSLGAITLDGLSLHQLTPIERARTVVPLFDPPDPTFGFTVRELVLMGRYPHLGPRAFESEVDREHAERALRDLELTTLADRPLHHLSAGERQRTALARVLCQDPRYLLLDEPTSRLDPAHVARVCQVLRGLASAGRGLLIVVHDLDLAARLADRVALLGSPQTDGLVTGHPREILAPALLGPLYGATFVRADAILGRVSILTE